MRVRLLSDLHLEGYFFPYEYCGEDVLILAGDITTSKHHGIFELLIEEVPSHVQILYVAGNHEYYHGIFQFENQYYERLQGKYENFFFLNNCGTTIGDVEFFGGTMFTDFALDGIGQQWFSRHASKDMIADFYNIEKALDGLPMRWTTQDHEDQHILFCKKLDEWLIQTIDKQRIVISHFMPHYRCVQDKFRGSSVNGYFTCDMSRYFGLMSHWFAGHGHNSIDEIIDGTRLVMNPKGYGTENYGKFKHNLIIEV